MLFIDVFGVDACTSFGGFSTFIPRLSSLILIMIRKLMIMAALFLSSLHFGTAQLTVSCPGDLEVVYSDELITSTGATFQDLVDASYSDFIDGFRYTADCDVAETDLSGFQAPPPSGGQITITYRVVDCNGAEEECESTFTVIGDVSRTIILTCPEDVLLEDCSSQTKVDSAWAAFIGSFDFIPPPGSSKTNYLITDLSIESTPNCGTSRTITYLVEHRSDTTIPPVECSRTFTLPSAPLINPLEGIPTMGEWGVIALLLIFLIVAVAGIKRGVIAAVNT